MCAHSRARAFLVVLALFLVALLASAGEASAETTFQWTGAGEDSAWSTPGNWEQEAAPAPEDGAVDLEFPAEACEPECVSMSDDLEGITVNKLLLADVLVAGEPFEPPFRQASSYSVFGTAPLTLEGGIHVLPTTVGTGQGIYSSPMTIAVPLVLGSSNVWSLGPSSLSMPDEITGQHSLQITLDGTTFQLEGDDNVGLATITGGGLVLGVPGTDGELNGTSGQPVVLNKVNFQGRGTFGPLTYDGGYMVVGFLGLGGDVHVSGPLVFKGGAHVQFDVPEPDGSAPRITSTGSATLGSAMLHILEGCASPGTVFTLVEADGGVSGTFTDLDGAPIVNGETIEPAANGCGTSSSAPSLRISYSANSVTATVLPNEPEQTSTTTQQHAPQPQQQQTVPAVQVIASQSASIASATVAAILAKEIAPTHSTLSIAQILRHRGLKIPFRAPEAGTALVDWYARHRTRHVRKAVRRHRVVIATGRLVFSAPGSATLYLRLTARGRRLLKHVAQLRVTARATFTPTGQSAVHASKTFLARRKHRNGRHHHQRK